MPPEPDDSAERERRVGQVLADYFAAVDSGRTPDRPALLARHPDLAAELAAYFEQQDRFARLVEPLQPAVAAAETTAPAQQTATLAPEAPGAGEPATLGAAATADASPGAAQATGPPS